MAHGEPGDGEDGGLEGVGFDAGAEENDNQSVRVGDADDSSCEASGAACGVQSIHGMAWHVLCMVCGNICMAARAAQAAAQAAQAACCPPRGRTTLSRW